VDLAPVAPLIASSERIAPMDCCAILLHPQIMPARTLHEILQADVPASLSAKADPLSPRFGLGESAGQRKVSWFFHFLHSERLSNRLKT